jgi:predicted DNA-binding protein
MPREKTIRVRLSDAEHESLKAYAEETDRMISEVVRDWIKKIKRKPS